MVLQLFTVWIVTMVGEQTGCYIGTFLSSYFHDFRLSIPTKKPLYMPVGVYALG